MSSEEEIQKIKNVFDAEMQEIGAEMEAFGAEMEAFGAQCDAEMEAFNAQCDAEMELRDVECEAKQTFDAELGRYSFDAEHEAKMQKIVMDFDVKIQAIKNDFKEKIQATYAERRKSWENSIEQNRIKTRSESGGFLGLGKKITEREIQIETRQNILGMKFILIPAGTYVMGSSPLEKHRCDDEGNLHTVTISKSFYIGQYPVTEETWRDFMPDTPSHKRIDDPHDAWVRKVEFINDLLPHLAGDESIDTISWNDAQEFIKKLNKYECIDKYRLPSEAEWEYACRAGTATRYSFGDSSLKLHEYANYSDTRLAYDSGCPSIYTKQPNPWGLYCMHGSAHEWVQDIYHSDYQGAPTDGSVWESGDDVRRVNRGGNCGTSAGGCRSASRMCSAPDSAIGGFRIVRDI